MTFAFSKWPEMTLTQNDPIELLKVILKGCGVVCIVLIISLIVACLASLIPSFNTIKTHRIPLRSIPVFLLFLLESWQNISRNSLFYPFHSAFYPSYFCLLRGWKVPSKPLFLALKSIFLLSFHRKTNSAFLTIFAWVMWFSVNNGASLFRGLGH